MSGMPTRQALAMVKRVIKIPILMYHKVAEPPPEAMNRALYVRPCDFRTQMERLDLWGYQALDFHDLATIFAGETPPKKGVIITFDDGFTDNFTNAFPILVNMKMKGTVFLVSDFLGKKSNWPESREKHPEPLLSIKQVEAMKKSGISFQAHSKTHRHLARLSSEEMQEEIRGSAEYMLRTFGEEKTCFCYPYGNYSDEVIKEVQSAGYKMACSIERGNRYTSREIFHLPRLPIHLDTTTKRLRYRMSFLYHMEHVWKH